MLVVVVGEEDLAEGAGSGQGSELAWKGRAVLEGLELRLAVRVVVRDMRAGMALADMQIGKQHCDRLGCHRRAAVSVDSDRCDAAVAGDSGIDECLGKLSVLGGVDLPVDGLARENVEHHEQVEPDAAGGSFQFRDVPAPDLAGAISGQLGADPGRVGGLGAPLADLVRGAQDPVHGGDAGQVDALIQQHRPRLGRGLVGEPAGVQYGQQLLLLAGRQGRGMRRPRPRRPFPRPRRIALPV